LYFVTICTDQRRILFGEVIDGAMTLNDTGKIVEGIWSDRFRFSADSDTWIVMPNHVHGIIAIGGIDVDASRIASPRKPLGGLIAAFKTISTKRINEIRGTPGAIVWQRNFYEHIIGTDRALEQIVAYIHDNPTRWERDPENPMAIKPDRNIPWR
jgi:REP element-mobilizing transposase RayT